MHSWHDVVRHIAASPDFESLLAGVSEFMVSGSRVLLFVVCFFRSFDRTHTRIVIFLSAELAFGTKT